MTRILAFHADWCGPCDQQEPILDAIANETDIVVDHYDVDTDNGKEVSNQYPVRSLPTTIVLDDDDTVVEQFIGVTSKDEILEAVA